jgi:hypothetical protein
MRTAKGHLPVSQAKSLTFIDPEAKANVLGHLEDKWSTNALSIQQRLSESVERDDASAAQKWAIAAGISTEKVLLMKGRPTEIIANLHAHRHELSPLMDKLASAARVLDVHVRKGYRPVVSLDTRDPKVSPGEIVHTFTSSHKSIGRTSGDDDAV